MKKIAILFLILMMGCIERPYGEAYFIGEGDDIIEPEEDIIEPEEASTWWKLTTMVLVLRPRFI